MNAAVSPVFVAPLPVIALLFLTALNLPLFILAYLTLSIRNLLRRFTKLVEAGRNYGVGRRRSSKKKSALMERSFPNSDGGCRRFSTPQSASPGGRAADQPLCPSSIKLETPESKTLSGLDVREHGYDGNGRP